MKVLEGKLTAEGLRVGIVAARFNEFITNKLVSGAIDALTRHGASEDNLTMAWCRELLKSPWWPKKWPAAEISTP